MFITINYEKNKAFLIKRIIQKITLFYNIRYII